MRDFEQRCTAPLLDYPIWCFEVCCACEGAKACQILGREEERVGELIFVDEKV